MSDLFPASEFDAWVDSYDQDVSADTGFPFDGYSRVLQTILDQADPSPGQTLLDLGTGTGRLAERFVSQGCRIWGLDFSAAMLTRARARLPGARLAQADLRGDWPPDFQRRFDRVVSAYTFHHFPLQEKLSLAIRILHSHLSPGGRLVIGDIAFQNAAQQAALRRELGQVWEQEEYWLADETQAAFSAAGLSAHWTKVSSCAGVFRIERLPYP